MAEETQLIIDDRRSGNHSASGGGNWRLVTDSVMGGISAGRLTAEEIDGRPCLRLQGEVSTKNSGGFIQAALELETGQLRDASGYDGVVIDVRGNGESYNLHLRGCRGRPFVPPSQHRGNGKPVTCRLRNSRHTQPGPSCNRTG
jgi:hypothetical protein